MVAGKLVNSGLEGIALQIVKCGDQYMFRGMKRRSDDKRENMIRFLSA